MKKHLYSLTISCLFALPLWSQGWNLVVAGGKYNFGMPGSSAVMNTILADALPPVGTDSIFIISPKRAISLSGAPYAAVVGSFIGDTVVKHEDFVYNFRFHPPTYSIEGTARTIHAKAEVGENWEYKPGVIATVTEKKDTTWWGTADSLKTIALSNGNMIRLSKKFGLLFMDSRTLIGLEGQDIGVQLPTIADFYADWINGAVFEFYETKDGSGSAYNSSKTWTKYYVLNKTVTPDSILIEVHKLQRRESSHTFLGNTTQGPTTYTDALTVYPILEPQKVIYPGGMKQTGALVYITRSYSAIPEGVKLSIDYLPFPGASQDVHINYKSGLGETLNSVIGYNSNVNTLIGHHRVGQTQSGQLHPDSFFGVVSSSREIDAFEQLTVFPNPTGDMIYIQCQDCPKATGAELMNATGQIVRTERFDASVFSLQTRDVPSGQYLLRIRFENGASALRKIVVQ